MDKQALLRLQPSPRLNLSWSSSSTSVSCSWRTSARQRVCWQSLKCKQSLVGVVQHRVARPHYCWRLSCRLDPSLYSKFMGLPLLQDPARSWGAGHTNGLVLNPLTAIDTNWRHENCWWCHFLGNFPLKIGSATAERVGRGEVGGVTRRVKMAPAKPCAACEAHPLGAERATCCVFSMSECRKLSFPLAAPPNCMFHGSF